jgi:hypothetical protein
MNVVIIAPESSGNHLFSDIFNKHKEINIEYASSFPRLKFKGRKYPDIKKWNKEDSCLIIIARDSTITKISVENHKHNENNAGKFSYDQTIGEILENINEWQGKILFVSYETLMIWKNVYLKHIFQQLGVSIDFPYEEINYVDGNAKYIKDI